MFRLAPEGPRRADREIERFRRHGAADVLVRIAHDERQVDHAAFASDDQQFLPWRWRLRSASISLCSI